MSQYDRTVIELIESASRTNRISPLFLGGGGGAGGGVGVPPGGIVGQLAQYRVAYDTSEDATLATLPSGVAGISGWSLVDNLNHIRYRIQELEGGGIPSSGIIVTDDNNTTEYSGTVNLHFIGSGVVVTDLGSGEVQIEINATGSGSGGIEEAPIDGNTYGRQDGAWVTISGTTSSGVPLTVEDVDGSPSITNVDKIVFSGATITDLGSGDVLVAFSGSSSEQTLHKYNDDLTSQIPSSTFTTSLVYASGTLRVYYNGVRQRKGVNYLDDVSFTTFSTYFTTSSGDTMIIDYDYLLSQQVTATPDAALVDGLGDVLLDSDGIIITESV